MNTPSSAVEFSNPPVVEVVLSVAFDPIPGLSLAHLVRIWDKGFKEVFPNAEEHPRYEPPIELFGPDRYESGLRLELGGHPPSPRLWFLDKEGANLLQLQNDWFARNWRKQDKAGEYIRYARLREGFTKDLTGFLAFVQEEGLGEMKPTQCEITYIDHIAPNEWWSTHADVAKVFRLIETEPKGFLPDPEDFRLATNYEIAGNGSSPVGRLSITVQSAMRKADNQPIFVMNTTARGAPLASDLKGVIGFLEIGHNWALRGFLDITTAEMHEAWGLRDA